MGIAWISAKSLGAQSQMWRYFAAGFDYLSCGRLQEGWILLIWLGRFFWQGQRKKAGLDP
jgi:hypothetical protein